MTEANANSPKSAKTRRLRWRHAAYVAAVIVIVAACCVAGLFWYASTPQFAEKVHRAVVLGLEKSTGGRVEIGSFRWNARHLTAEVDNLTIHGTEAPGEAPYLHVDHLALQARILTFFTPSWIPRIALASLIAEGPTLHLIVYPDGSTNQPKPQTPSKHSLQQRLLGLEIGHTRVENGLILLNNRRIPWEMAAGSLSVEMRYVAADHGYEATLDAKDITFRLKKAMEAHSQLRARISLEHNAIRVQELDLKTGDSQLQAKGELHDFANPNWMASIHGSIDARQVGAITGETELRGGTAAVSLRARGTSNASRPEAFQIAGHVDMRGADWEAPWLRLQKVELHTDLTIDNDQCSFTNFSSVLEDQGRVDGSLILKHCIGPSAPVIVPPNDRTRSAAVTHSRLRAWMERHPGLSPREFLKRLRGEHRRVALQKRLQNAEYRPLEANLQAQVSGITLPLILAATAPKPYWNIGFTTATFGKVTAHWTGDGNGLDVHGVLTMRAPRNLNGLIPVTGSATADYLGDHRHLAITDADEHTPGTQVHAAGLLTLLTNDPKTDLRMDVTGNNLGEFDRLLTILDLKETPAGEPHALPLRLLGNATFHGDIHGSYFALAATGRLDAGKFQMVVERSAKEGEKITGASPPRFLTWDAFHSDVSYTPSHLIVRDAELVRGHTDIHVGLNMVPERTAPGEYTYDRRSQIAASVQTTGASVADLQSIAGISYPATGTLAADAHVTGTAGDWTGAGQALLTNAWIRGQKISVASIHLSILGHVVHAPHIRLTAAGGHASGQLTYDYESGALTGELTGRDFALAEIAALQTPRAAVGGRAGFHLQASGQASSPNATLVLQTEDVTLNQQPMGEVRVAAHLQNGTMYVTSSAKFRKARMDAAGQVRFSGDDPAKLEMTFAGLDIDPLLRMLAPNGVGGHSTLDGHITVSGPLKEPAAMEGSADVETFAASVDRLPIHADGPIRLSLHKGKLQLDQVRFQGKSMSLSASGTVDLLDGYRLRLHSEGAIDASLASAFNRNIQSSGQIRFVVNAYGTAKRPDLRGRAEVSHVNVHLADVTNGLTDMNGELAFDQDRLAIQRLQGSSGGGALALTGFIGYRNGIFVDVTATANEVRIRYPKGVSTAVDAKLRLLGTSDSLLLSGNVKAMRFGIGSNVDLTSFMTGASGVSGPIDPTSPLNRVRLDIHVTSAPELAFQNSFASLAGDVNLRIRGTLENSSILGRIDISEGSASFAGTRYRLQQGDITFNNPITISPEINLEATARVQNYDIIVSLHGPPSKLNISYRSEPPLTQADVLALLALGRTNEQATMYGEQQQANANLTTEALLGGALNAAVSSRVQKLFGVGSVRVDPNFVGTLGESTARVTVEQQVGRNVTLTFATNVNTTAQQLIQAQFDLTRNLSIIAVRDEADVFSAYLQIRGRHK